MFSVVQVRNVTRGTTLATAAEVADGRWRRLIGLIGRQRFPHGAGLILPSTPWVHTAFMAFPIDAVFYTRAGYVLRTVEHLLPWRVSPFCWLAYAALELPVGTVESSRTRASDLLQIERGSIS